MNVVVAFYGHHEYVSNNDPSKLNSWKVAWQFFVENVYEVNSKHSVKTVFHTWESDTTDLVSTLKPDAYVIDKQSVYSDDDIPSLIKRNPEYRSYAYNNLKNRLHSMKRAVELAESYKPDVVLLTRFDCVFNFPVLFESLELGNNIHAPNWAPLVENYICDHYYVGSYDAMSRFVSVRLTPSVFEPGSEYTKWLKRNDGFGENRVNSHILMRWMLESTGLMYVHYGIQGRDTCVARQLQRIESDEASSIMGDR